MSDAGNYCADCRFLHGAGVGYHAGSGGEVRPPLIRAAAGQGVAGAAELADHGVRGGGGGARDPRAYIGCNFLGYLVHDRLRSAAD